MGTIVNIYGKIFLERLKVFENHVHKMKFGKIRRNLDIFGYFCTPVVPNKIVANERIITCFPMDEDTQYN